MITIRITNAAEIVEKEKGWMTSHLGGLFVDLETKVEELVIHEIKAAFQQRKVEAVFSRVPNPEPENVETT